MLRAEGISYESIRAGGAGRPPDLPRWQEDPAQSGGAAYPPVGAPPKEGFPALHRTDFYLPPGALALICGPSGSGKSTLLRILAGLLKPTTGAVYLDNTDIYQLKDAERSRLRAQRIGYVSQRPELLPDLTVLENVMLPRRLYNAAGDVRSAALTLLDRAGLIAVRDVPAEALSGGELRRVALVRALAQKPEVFLVDAPTAGLDEESAERVLSLLRQSADSGAAVLFSAQDEAAEDAADAVCRIDHGCLSEGG